MWETFILLAILGAAGAYIHDTLACGELARRHGKVLCDRVGLQWLDQSVALRSVRPALASGLPRLRRRYSFEVSRDGADRVLGELSMLGRKLEWARIPEPLPQQ